MFCSKEARNGYSNATPLKQLTKLDSRGQAALLAATKALCKRCYPECWPMDKI